MNAIETRRNKFTASCTACHRTVEAGAGSLALDDGKWIVRCLPVCAPVAVAPKVSIPAGHYAVASATGNNDLDFYSVDRPTDGHWAGYLFVKRVIGGQPSIRVRGTESAGALARIAKAGVEAAAVLYGQEIGRCYLCNRHLTDETSRALGIGPDCRSK